MSCLLPQMEYRPKAVELPARVDWREKNVVNRPGFQGSVRTAVVNRCFLSSRSGQGHATKDLSWAGLVRQLGAQSGPGTKQPRL